ncbi:MAG: SRPBCC family protein [Nitriliruptoraceae bacterium]
MLLELAREVDAAPGVVWSVLTDWERQPQWMLDAQQVVVLTPERRGVGVTIRCPTNLFGVIVQDVMRVTAWEPRRRLAVVHLGRIITGTAAFELEELPGGRTRVTWWEHVDPPLGALGEWGATTLVRPILRRVFARSLARFATLAEQQAVVDTVADDVGQR